MIHGPCDVGDYSLVGINSTILQGAKLGKGSILAAGSVLREETEDFCLYAGVPAIKKKEYPNKRLNEFSSKLYADNGQRFKSAGYAQKIPEEFLTNEKKI
jgi:carbonic anhydrase/acetyltransferase-like protein (isoleucine patch superfamily)